MHVGPKKYRHFPNVLVEDAHKVLGCVFNLKWAIGATKGVTDDGITSPTNKTPLSSNVLLYVL